MRREAGGGTERDQQQKQNDPDHRNPYCAGLASTFMASAANWRDAANAASRFLGVAAVAGALTRLRPDVLVIDFESLYPDGSVGPSGGARYLRGSAAEPPHGGETGTLADHPALIHLTMTAWSKVFRRDFLAGLGVSFGSAGPAPHEDVPVTTLALLTAGRIGVLDRVCYRYRRSRRGSYLAAVSDAAHPAWRASALGVYRFWRDAGYALGALIGWAVGSAGIYAPSTGTFFLRNSNDAGGADGGGLGLGLGLGPLRELHRVEQGV